MLIEEVELWDFNDIDFQCINALQQQSNINSTSTLQEPVKQRLLTCKLNH